MRSLLLLCALTLGACATDPSDTDRASSSCVDDGDCEGLAVCGSDNTCRTVECRESGQCAMGSHCNPDSHTCFTGCLADQDCFLGQVCEVETTTCVEAACADPVIDCYPGEVCSDQGECGVPNGLCEPCQYWDAEDPCTAELGGQCLYSYGVGYSCFLPCDPQGQGGPRDFPCMPLSEGSETYVFYGDCSRLVPEGEQ